jgi:hypothetical protein
VPQTVPYPSDVKRDSQKKEWEGIFINGAFTTGSELDPTFFIVETYTEI